MQLARQLKAAGIDTFPCAVRYDTVKQRWQKQPLTVNREPWGTTALRAIDDPQVAWRNCEVLGIPIPAGVVIVDLDCYKPGVTPENVSMMLGVQMPWEQALIQTTISGGHHYAFRLPEWQVKQGDNLCGPGSGVDTRVAGKGFICSGGGYAPGPDGVGVFKLAHPSSLPVLPDGCRHVFEHIQQEAPAPAQLVSSDDRDPDLVRQALAHIDPTERGTWRNVGFAIKHYFHDDEGTGFAIWDDWSRGDIGHGECPTSYDPDTQYPQWQSFKAVKEGATITIGTLFHMAIVGGWQPPAKFDTASAFGAGAISIEAFDALVAKRGMRLQMRAHFPEGLGVYFTRRIGQKRASSGTVVMVDSADPQYLVVRPDGGKRYTCRIHFRCVEGVC